MVRQLLHHLPGVNTSCVSVGIKVLVGKGVSSCKGVGVQVGGNCKSVGVGVGISIVGGRVGNGNGFSELSGLM